jgi:ssDNA-binding Zn-finger/Zn-ribbon topoisomerase 1
MFQKLKFALMRMMQGRHGADQLSRFMLWAALLLYALSMVPALWFFSYLGLAVLLLSLFRALSKNAPRRYAENAKYLQLTAKLRAEWSQARARFKNRKAYKYLRCPNCRSWLKLKRGAGEGTLTCGKCRHAFKAKA